MRERSSDVLAFGACVIDSADLGPAYPRIAECRFEVMAFVPRIGDVDLRLLVQYDAALIACSGAELADSSFQMSAMRITKTIRSVAIGEARADPAIAAQLGFRGFLLRDVAPQALERTMAAIVAGEIAFPRGALTGLFRLFNLLPLEQQGPERNGGLTPRQQQIVDLIAQGATDREIATRLRISQSTAHKHVQNALRRSNARTRSQLVAVARQPALG